LHRTRIERVITLFPMLATKWSSAAGNLSGGEQQVLETAMVLVTHPSLVLLDEPSLGLSPKMQTEVFAAVRDIASQGVTVLVVEQNVHGALLISDRAVVMEARPQIHGRACRDSARRPAHSRSLSRR